jgi:hypothetical protein
LKLFMFGQRVKFLSCQISHAQVQGPKCAQKWSEHLSTTLTKGKLENLSALHHRSRMV